jgi:hypothetical protein
VPSSPASGTTSSSPIWPWLLLALAVVAVVVAFVLRNASAKRAAREAAHRRGLRAYSDAVALHDRAAVLPMSEGAERTRLLDEVTTGLDRVAGEFEALAAEPALQDAGAEIGDVRTSLTDLRGAVQAQLAAGAIDQDLLRQRLAVLDDGLQRFRQRLAAGEPASPQGRT